MIDKMQDCPVLGAVSIVGGKWRARILWRLREGPAGFGELKRALKVSEKVLTENLRCLEVAGIVSRTSFETGQVAHVSYAYTELGRSLCPLLDALGEWWLIYGPEVSASSAEYR